MRDETTLYRFYKGDILLYVGISSTIDARLSTHRSASSWYELADTVHLERLPTRRDALRAEKAAVIREQPRFNRVHNQRPSEYPTRGRGRWNFRSLKGEWDVWADLSLYPELRGASVTDPAQDDDNPVRYYWNWLEESHPEWITADAVPVIWTVVNYGIGLSELAPFQSQSFTGMPPKWDFLTYFSWPVDALGQSLRWAELPVVPGRYPLLEKALGWTPAPMTPTAPIASILRVRDSLINLADMSRYQEFQGSFR